MGTNLLHQVQPPPEVVHVSARSRFNGPQMGSHAMVTSSPLRRELLLFSFAAIVIGAIEIHIQVEVIDRIRFCCGKDLSLVS